MADRPLLRGYQLLPEGGRASYFYPHYTIVHMYGVQRRGPWQLITTGNVGNARNHLTKWHMVTKGAADFDVHLEPFLADPHRMDTLEQRITEIRQEMVKKLRGDLSKLSRDDLADLAQFYYTQYEELVVTAGMLRYLDRAIVQRLKRDVPAALNPDEVIRLTAISDRETSTLQEERALLALALSVVREGLQTSDPEVTAQLHTIARRFAFLTLGYFNEPPKSLEDYRRALADVLTTGPDTKLEVLNRRLKEDHTQRGRVLARLDATLVPVATLAAGSSFLKDYYKRSVNEVQYAAEPLFAAIASALGYTPEFVKDLSPEEVPAALRGRAVDEALVQKRIEHNVLIRLGDALTVLLGVDADAFEQEYLTAGTEDRSEFRGRVASPGSGRGIARVVMSPQDFPKVHDGDILVVTNTSPDFFPIMRKAAAIAAEEGGITAHVSVVSRELGIPCVVGLSHITTQIHDGDEVEVDAEKGVVRVVKRAE